MTAIFRIVLLPLLTAVLAAGTAVAAPLTLRDAERLAIERNLNLKAQTYSTRASEALVRAGFGIYNPVLQADVAAGEARRIFDTIQTTAAFGNLSTSEYRRFNFSLIQPLPTGASVALDFDNQRQDLDPVSANVINPAWNNAVRLSLVQPLLRGFGRTVTEQEILFAVRDRNIAVEELRLRAFDIITAVRDAWFDALRYRDEVEFRRTSVSLSEQVLKENRARVDAGVLPPVEILEAQVGVQLRERELLDSQRAYEDAIDRLTLQLNLSEPVEVANVPLTAPQVQVSVEEGLRAALALRPDLRQQEEQVARLELTRQLARNNTLPQLDVAARYGHSGFDADYGDALGDLSDTNFRSWEVGLLFSYPIGNTTARNQLQRSQLLLSGQKALLGQVRDEIRQEIRAAVRDLDVNWKVIEVTELGTRLARERLQTLLKRREVGLATTRDVLEGEEDLAEARTQHIAALANYNRALTAYLRATGELLDRQGIRIARELSPSDQGPLVEAE
ncbi:MAG: TolC family protein [Desulfuromonadales bacterium]|nr:TolC family protein [Desulfuromonadales bacterium]